MVILPEYRLALTGELTILGHDLHGRLLESETVSNMILMTGRNLVRDRLFANEPFGPLTHFAGGTDNATPLSTQTALGDEKHRNFITSLTPTDGQIVMRYFMSSTSGNGFTYREAGLVNAAASGIFYCRATFADKVKTIAKTFTFIWTFTLGG